MLKKIIKKSKVKKNNGIEIQFIIKSPLLNNVSFFK